MSSGTQALRLVSRCILIGQKSLLGGKSWHFPCASLASFVTIKKTHSVVHAHFSPIYSSPPMFQDPTNKPHLNLKTCT